MNNLFENAKFGDKFKCRDGSLAFFIKWKNGHPIIIDSTSKTTTKLNQDGWFWKNHEQETPSDVVSKYPEDLSVYQWFRCKTACGLSDAKVYLSKLIEALKHKPIFRTDSRLKLVYEEVIDEDELDKLAYDFAHCFTRLNNYEHEKDYAEAYKYGFRNGREGSYV